MLVGSSDIQASAAPYAVMFIGCGAQINLYSTQAVIRLSTNQASRKQPAPLTDKSGSSELFVSKLEFTIWVTYCTVFL